MFTAFKFGCPFSAIGGTSQPCLVDCSITAEITEIKTSNFDIKESFYMAMEQ